MPANTATQKAREIRLRKKLRADPALRAEFEKLQSRIAELEAMLEQVTSPQAQTKKTSKRGGKVSEQEGEW